MTSKYWHDRKVQYDHSLARDEKRLYSKLAAYYEREAAQLDKEIAAYYARYGVNGVLSYRNLLETLPDADKELLIEQIDAFVKRYPEYADLVPVRESIYKLNRLEGLRQSIAMQQLHMGAYEQAQALAFFQKQALRYANGAASYLGLGSSFCRIDSDLIQAAVGNRWCSGKDFSERIWDNRTKLADTLHTQVINGVIRGEDYHRLARQLREKFTQVSQKNAERLIFTEDTYLSNEAAMQVFEREAAVTEYEYVCTNDSSSCDICRGLDGQRFRISQRMPGTNFPPMHPWCRCFFDPVVPDLIAFRSRKNADTALTSGADGGIIKAYQLNTTSKQFGKKIGKHAADYGLDPAKEEDREKLKHRIQEIASTPDCVIPGTWRGQGEMQADGKQQDGVVDYVIKDSDVIVAKDGNFITIIKDGIHSSGRIRKTYEEYLNEKR